MKYRIVLALLASLALISACGSSSGSGGGSGSSGDTITLSGSASVVDVSASINAGKSVSKSAADLTCRVFTMEGEEVLSATTNDAGEFTGSAVLADVKPADASEDTWEEKLICECQNDTGSIYVARFAEISVDESSTTTVSCGELTREGMLALETVIDELNDGLGCDPRDGTACIPPEDVDLRCVFDADLSSWEGASRDDDGISDDFALMRDFMFAAQDAGLRPEDINEDFDHWGECADAVRDGELTEEEMGILVQEVADLFDLTEEEALQILEDAAALEAKKREIFEEHIYGTDGALAADANGAVAEGDAEEELCPTGDEMDALIGPFMHADDLADMEQTFGDPRVWAQMEEMLDNVEDDDFSRFIGDEADVVHTFLGSFEGDFEGFEGDDFFIFMIEVEGDMDPEDVKEAARAYHGALAGGNIDDETTESARAAFFGEIFADDFDFEEDFEDAHDTFEQFVELETAHGEDFDASECEALELGSTAQHACYEELANSEEFGGHDEEFDCGECVGEEEGAFGGEGNQP